jgi:ferrous iron transport protein B
MATQTAETTLSVALIGNPNTGKSTLFTALAGVRQQVGNYPGVTVEKKIGHMQFDGQRYALVDLPGTYSLAPRSLDEMVTVDVLLGRREDAPRPDAVLCIVDASNLERNLYLVSQVLELGLPTVVALNMVDIARQKGVEIDIARLERQLGLPVVPVQANRKIGIDKLKTALAAAMSAEPNVPPSPFPDAFKREVDELENLLAEGESQSASQPKLPRYLLERLLLDTGGYLEDYMAQRHDWRAIRDAVLAARARLAAAGCPVPAVEAMARYGWVSKVLEGVVRRPNERPVTASDRIDHVLTHWLWGSLFFLLMMLLVFQAVFTWAKPPMDWISGGIEALGELTQAHMAEGALRSLVVDGIFGGVGGVLVFLPQIFFLFFFIAVLEDCGYMARAAYLMDRLMVPVGLSGKSFIPLLSSFACAIPGIMATRVIENRRDRLTTILVAPLMSCSARLPVYTLLSAAFIPDLRYLGGWMGLRALTIASMYLIGMLVAMVVALLLKRTVLRGPTPPFVMELPSYKMPSVNTVLYRMFERGWAFIRRAGTLIVAVSIVVWAALYYPHDAATVEAPFQVQRESLQKQIDTLPEGDADRMAAEEKLARLEKEIEGAYERQSWLGRMGHAIEPAVRPLGWDWRIGSAVIASFPAREVVVATLGIIYNLGGEVDLEKDDDRTQLETALRNATWDGTDRPVYNIPVALSIMVFFSLCAQCAATLAVIKRETNSWRWPLFTFVYMTGLAYLAALATYQLGMMIPG